MPTLETQGRRLGKSWHQDYAIRLALAAGKTVAFCNAEGVRVMKRHRSGLVVIEQRKGPGSEITGAWSDECPT